MILLAPELFAIAFVLELFSANIGELSLKALVVPLASTVLFTAVISGAFILLSRNKLPRAKSPRHSRPSGSTSLFSGLRFVRGLKTLGIREYENKIKGSLLASVFTILFFSYSGVASLLGKSPFIFPAFVGLILLSFFLVRKMTRSLAFASRFVPVMAIAAVLLPLAGIIRYEAIEGLYLEAKSPLVLPDPDKLKIKGKPPDIYYIVPDSYSASEVLGKYFHYDNSNFVDFLKSKGFYVASQSAENYPKTFVSLASCLNMEYLDYLSDHKNSSDQNVVKPLIKNSNVLRFLKSLGYKYYQMGSWWGLTHYNRFADDNFILERKKFGGIGEFNYIVLRSTMVSPFLEKIVPAQLVGESDDDKRRRIIYQFDEFKNITRLDSPKFVFAHIIAPHEPYVFDQDCQFITREQTEGKTEEKNYTNQLNCINKKLEETINTIIKNSARPPIILLQSDEGAQFLGRWLTPPDNWKKANQNLIKKKFPIMSAYYLPGVSKSILYPSISPVNSFRAIFNLYFSANFPLLPDKNYIFPDTKHLYEFKDVTNQMTSSPTNSAGSSVFSCLSLT